jgi:hypothetical protein
MMKKLEPVIVDGHTVEIEAHREAGGIRFVATSGSVKREHVMAMHTDSPSSKEQHLANVKAAIDLLTKEVLGHKQNEGLLDDYFADEAK